MPINPMIPLAGQYPDYGGRINELRQQKRDNARQNELLELAQARDARDAEAQTFELDAAKKTQARQASDEEFRSMAVGAMQAKQLLESGDTEGLRRFIANRTRDIVAKGGDPQDTLEIAGLLNAGKVDQVKSLLDSTVLAGQQRGLIGAGEGKRVQSTQILDDNKLALIYSDGTQEITDLTARGYAMRPTETGAGNESFDPTTGRTTGLISPQATAEALRVRQAADAGATQASREGATTEAIPDQVAARTRSERFATQVDEGFAAADALPVINRAVELLGTVKTGGINAAALAASNWLGVTGADEAELSNNLGKAVLSQLRSTFGAAFTEREGARLDNIEANFGKSTEGNKRLLEQLKRMVEREAVRGMNAARSMGDEETANSIREAMSFSLSTDRQVAPSGGMDFQPNGGWSVEVVE